MKVLTKKELQKIANNIITSENTLYNINIQLFALTKEELLNEKENFDKMNVDFPFQCINNNNYGNFPAVYSKQGDNLSVFMGIENYVSILPTFFNRQKYRFITSLYHEIRHGLQDININNSQYMNLIFKMENIINYFNFSYYVKNKNKFLIEIDAGLYAYNKALNYVLNEKRIKKEILYDIKRNIINFEQRKKQYDFDFIFQGLVDLVAKYPRLAKDGFLSIFFDNNGHLKNISSIINDENFIKLDYLFKIDVVYYFKGDINNIKDIKEYTVIKDMNRSIELEEYYHKNKIDKIKKLMRT